MSRHLAEEEPGPVVMAMVPAEVAAPWKLCTQPLSKKGNTSFWFYDALSPLFMCL
jgi:hypothetical protein